MNPDYYSLIELAFVGIVVLGLAIWQLISVNREIRKDKAKRESPEGSGHPVGEHRLDDR